MISMDRNTCPISPLSSKDIENAVQNTSLHLYPEEEYQRFIELYAARYNIKSSSIELANGSDEWIQKIILTLGAGGVASLQPDFNMYEIYAGQTGTRYSSIGAEEDYSFDHNKIVNELRRIKPSVFFISNPHNPTGILFPDDFLDHLSSVLNEWGGYLIVDEAYVEFSPKPYTPKTENTIIIRTMSKIYGMAGLRIGILIAEGETFNTVTRINHPYPLNSVSLNLGIQLFTNEEQLNHLVHYQIRSKRELENALNYASDSINIKPSNTNFVFTYGSNANSLALYLKKYGFSPRIYDESYLSDAVRYSITELENYSELVTHIKDWNESIDHKK